MRITYDPEVDALYIRFTDESVEATTQRLTEDVAINYSPSGQVVGIEILDAAQYVFHAGAEPRVVLHNLAAVTA